LIRSVYLKKKLRTEGRGKIRSRAEKVLGNEMGLGPYEDHRTRSMIRKKSPWGKKERLTEEEKAGLEK